MFRRWWIYQSERFPVVAHGALIAAFSSSAVSFSLLLRGGSEWPSVGGMAVAFVTCFLFFLQLRIADEFKDHEEDCKYRPYRPVPRGLVTLRELGVVGVLAAGIQLGLAIWLAPRLLVLLLVAWTYLVLMTKEFFVRDWLVKQPLIYMLSHMVIMPLVDLYATACDWVVVGATAGPRLWLFLMVSFFNGVSLEIGRKIRAPEDEEDGVDTYSAVWGRRRAVAAWWIALLTTGIFAIVAAEQIEFLMPVCGAVGLVLAAAVMVGARFLREPVPSRSKWFEIVSGIWTLTVYLSLGLVPLLWKLLIVGGG